MLNLYNVWDSVTTSNTTDLPRGLSHGLWVGGTGDVAAVQQDNTVRVWSSVPAGSYLPIAARRINATSTTATNIFALYQV